MRSGAWIAIARADLRAVARDGTARAALLTLVVALGFGAWNGASVAREQRAAEAQRRAEIERRNAGLEAPISPVDLELDARLPTAALASLSIGRLRLDPTYAGVSFWTREDQLFANYQVASPMALQLGGFDLGFVVVAIVPLIVVVLGHGILTQERDDGRLAHLLSFGVGALQLLSARLAVRAAVVAAPVLIAAVAAGASARDPARLSLWLATALVVMAVAWSGVALGSVFRVRAESLAATLVALYVATTLLIPGAIVAAAGAIHPPPSRARATAELRAAEVAARDAVPDETARFMHDHPDLQRQPQGSSYVPDWMRGIAMVHRAIDRHLEAPLAELEASLAAQRRIAIAAELASPALMAQRLFAEAAGTSEERHRAYRAEARAYARRVRGEIVHAAFAARPLSSEEVAGLERFAFPEEPPAALWRRNVVPLGHWALVAAALAAFAAHRARSLSPL